MFGQKTKAVEEPVEAWEVRRRRELLADLKLYDASLDSLISDLRDERTKSGFTFYAEMPTSMKSARMLALQGGLIQLSSWHSQALKEHAALV